ncbi:hypothetical protein AUJ84_03755 [Candidatus Pacearchaeota archaeon CG1_02_32_132]|nr:MAG: hypothetical protein AUJ84_03755 [Candidatus Pacearchaeota archaeon CG1_02_32_132]
MNPARKLNEWQNRIGVRKLLNARRRDPEKWNEIFETKDNADVDRATHIHYLKNLGRKNSDANLTTLHMGGSTFVGALASVTALHLNRNYGLNINEGLICISAYLGTTLSLGFLGFNYLNKKILLEPETYPEVRKRALENIAQKRYWRSYTEGGAD